MGEVGEGERGGWRVRGERGRGEGGRGGAAATAAALAVGTTTSTTASPMTALALLKVFNGYCTVSFYVLDNLHWITISTKRTYL